MIGPAGGTLGRTDIAYCKPLLETAYETGVHSDVNQHAGLVPCCVLVPQQVLSWPGQPCKVICEPGSICSPAPVATPLLCNKMFWRLSCCTGKNPLHLAATRVGLPMFLLINSLLVTRLERRTSFFRVSYPPLMDVYFQSPGSFLGPCVVTAIIFFF